MDDHLTIASDSTHCIKLYNEYLDMLQDVAQQLETTRLKVIETEAAANTLRKLRPSDMIYTTMWRGVKTAITLTNTATKQIAPKILDAIRAVNKAKEATKKIKEATETNHDKVFICGRCKIKNERTTDNVMNLFGMDKSNQPFTTCCKCREISNDYKKTKGLRKPIPG